MIVWAGDNAIDGPLVPGWVRVWFTLGEGVCEAAVFPRVIARDDAALRSLVALMRRKLGA